MGNHTPEAIAARLAPAKPDVPRRNIMLNLPDDLVERLALLAKTTAHLSGQKVTRNMLIIDALEAYVAECGKMGLPGKTKKRTALYCRAATPDAAALSYQRTTLQDYAKAMGFDTLIRYEDNGYPVTDPDRPAFTRLEQDIRDGKVARVLAMSLSCVGRNTEEVLRWARFLLEHGAELITMDMPNGGLTDA